MLCYKQKCKVVSLNLAHPVYAFRHARMSHSFFATPPCHDCIPCDPILCARPWTPYSSTRFCAVDRVACTLRPGGELVSADTMLARDHPATINIFCVLRCHRPSFHQPARTCHASTEMSFVHTILVYHAATAELRARFSSTLCSHAVCQLCGVETSLRQRYRTRFT